MLEWSGRNPFSIEAAHLAPALRFESSVGSSRKVDDLAAFLLGTSQAKNRNSYIWRLSVYASAVIAGLDWKQTQRHFMAVYFMHPTQCDD